MLLCVFWRSDRSDPDLVAGSGISRRHAAQWAGRGLRGSRTHRMLMRLGNMAVSKMHALRG
eukprot:6704911-Alexandrium_andersonii.AAC.1